jgi:hypothetical protein
MKLQISEPKIEDGEKSGNPDSKKNYLKFLNYIHKKSMSQSVKDLKPYHPPAPS